VFSAPPPARRGANYIPGLAVGVGERGRRKTIKGAQDRKIKSGFANNSGPATDKIYIFVVSAAYYCHKPVGWKKSPINWMHSEKDRPLTFTQLLDSLLEGVRAKVTRTEYIVKGLSSGGQHRAKVEGVHRTLSLVQQTPPYGVRCGDPRNRKEKE
jgi:hypothetical protein